jgi:hypothetical protein
LESTKVADPFVINTDARFVPPSLKITVPVGEPEPDMMAVRTTFWPTVICEGVAESAVEVPKGVGWVTVTMRGLEVEEASPGSPV